MKKHGTLTRAQFIRLSDDDVRQIEDAAHQLGLSQSEITRRSLRIALPILRGFNLPGARREEPRRT